MPPVPSTTQAPPAVDPAPLRVGRFTVESRVESDFYITWFVKIQGAIPGTWHIEAIAIDRARALKLAGALAAAQAVVKLLPHLQELDAEHDHEGALHENLAALVAALRFMNTGGAER